MSSTCEGLFWESDIVENSCMRRPAGISPQIHSFFEGIGKGRKVNTRIVTRKGEPSTANPSSITKAANKVLSLVGSGRPVLEIATNAE